MAEAPRLFMFEFRGHADIRPSERPDNDEFVGFLNNVSGRIAQEIQQEIKRALPPSVNVEAQISFFQGSVTWEGVIVVLDWMARLGGTAEFLGVLVTLVQIAVDRVLRRWLSEQSTFRVRLAGPVQTEVTMQTVNKQPMKWNAMSALTALTVVNTLLLVALLIVSFVR